MGIQELPCRCAGGGAPHSALRNGRATCSSPPAKLGFDSINVDLIYGLPYQTADTFAHTVDQILGLAPDRIALFSYAHVPWLKKAAGLLRRASP